MCPTLCCLCTLQSAEKPHRLEIHHALNARTKHLQIIELGVFHLPTGYTRLDNVSNIRFSTRIPLYYRQPHVQTRSVSLGHLYFSF